jgi:site-specific DNA-cytosine methylase
MRKTYRESAYGEWVETEKAAVLRNHGGLYGGGSENIVSEEKFVDVRNSKEYDKNGALQSRASNNLQSNNVVRTQYAVRRLTPIECERLQGMPFDNFTLIDDKSCSDSARYKALGNGMAQPVANWVIQRIVEEVNAEDND